MSHYTLSFCIYFVLCSVPFWCFRKHFLSRMSDWHARFREVHFLAPSAQPFVEKRVAAHLINKVLSLCTLRHWTLPWSVLVLPFLLFSGIPSCRFPSASPYFGNNKDKRTKCVLDHQSLIKKGALFEYIYGYKTYDEPFRVS